MKILVLEDDQFQANDIKQYLSRTFNCDVICIATELSFRTKLQSGELDHCNVAVVDMMLRWTDPSPDMELPPKKVLESGRYSGGVRCCEALKLKKIPCVIYTALDVHTVSNLADPKYPIVNKSEGYDVLTDEIRQLLTPPQP